MSKGVVVVDIPDKCSDCVFSLRTGIGVHFTEKCHIRNMGAENRIIAR